jgi:Ca-activated chloride channel homolog
MSANENGIDDGPGKRASVAVDLDAAPERRLIRPRGSYRHMDFRLKVSNLPDKTNDDRQPLVLALVLDRSGSMAGDKLITAKSAALAVLDRLDERDQIAVVVFDDKIDTIQSLAPVTPDIKAHVRASLARIEARATTALHQGWLTGCHAIAGDGLGRDSRALTRCFLLTDGLANVGISDPEQIAAQAAGIRENAGIGTSTFGVGLDYDELLLRPMAVAGGGQFHNLRNAREIANTFAGELGDLLAVAAKQVRIEIQVDPGIKVEVVSTYWVSATPDSGRYALSIGDLLGGEERQIVVRFGFPAKQVEEVQGIRARAVWLDGNGERHTDWQEVRFTYASDQLCDGEVRDPAVMHWVGLHHAERAKIEAAEMSRRGDLKAARHKLEQVAKRIAEYAGEDQDLLTAIRELKDLDQQLSVGPMSVMQSKEVMFESQCRSRGQKDFRQ